jgi:hypothetical protein
MKKRKCSNEYRNVANGCGGGEIGAEGVMNRQQRRRLASRRRIAKASVAIWLSWRNGDIMPKYHQQYQYEKGEEMYRLILAGIYERES